MLGWVYLFVLGDHESFEDASGAHCSFHEELEVAVRDCLGALWERRPQLRVLVSVSPVRHIRSGLIENTASKSLLRVLCQQLTDRFPLVEYFPGYELILDDLRDYRFYERDLIHPNELALDYIWEKFSQKYFSPATQSLIQQLTQIHRDLAHRPQNPGSVAHQNFLGALERRIASLEPHLDMSAERAQILS